MTLSWIIAKSAASWRSVAKRPTPANSGVINKHLDQTVSYGLHDCARTGRLGKIDDDGLRRRAEFRPFSGQSSKPIRASRHHYEVVAVASC
ncbi:MAG TPA: hypothetical protein VK390_03485 [Propionibacteriaceae bacterium]|nr:hypothetical protein [Propionibacteriaceae bacterium]